jgi:hypothetical protein
MHPSILLLFELTSHTNSIATTEHNTTAECLCLDSRGATTLTGYYSACDGLVCSSLEIKFSNGNGEATRANNDWNENCWHFSQYCSIDEIIDQLRLA